MNLSHGSRRGVFLDRDGTVIAEKHYLGDPAGVSILPGATAGLRRLRDLGYRLVILTNQSGVGRGYFRQEDVDAVHARLGALLADEGVRLDGIYFCPHRPEDHCACRKPNPGLVHSACRDLDLDCNSSIMIGDKASDIELGRRCGMRTVLVATGHEATETCRADVVVGNLEEAAAWIAGEAAGVLTTHDHPASQAAPAEAPALAPAASRSRLP